MITLQDINFASSLYILKNRAEELKDSVGKKGFADAKDMWFADRIMEKAQQLVKSNPYHGPLDQRNLSTIEETVFDILSKSMAVPAVTPTIDDEFVACLGSCISRLSPHERAAFNPFMERYGSIFNRSRPIVTPTTFSVMQQSQSLSSSYSVTYNNNVYNSYTQR